MRYTPGLVWEILNETVVYSKWVLQLTGYPGNYNQIFTKTLYLCLVIRH